MPWVSKLSQTHGLYYWLNTDTGATQWSPPAGHHPVDGQAAVAPPPAVTPSAERAATRVSEGGQWLERRSRSQPDKVYYQVGRALRALTARRRGVRRCAVGPAGGGVVCMVASSVPRGAARRGAAAWGTVRTARRGAGLSVSRHSRPALRPHHPHLLAAAPHAERSDGRDELGQALLARVRARRPRSRR